MEFCNSVIIIFKYFTLYSRIYALCSLVMFSYNLIKFTQM